MSTENAKLIHDTYRVISVNAVACELFRCDERGMVDQSMLDLIASEDMRGLARLRLGIMRDNQRDDLPDIKYPFLRCDGSVFWGSITTRKLSQGVFETTVLYEDEARTI